MEVTQIISIVSVILGLILLLTSSLFVDVVRSPYDNCKKLVGSGSPLCKTYLYFLIAGSFGIIAALIQIGAFILAYLKQLKIWCALHIAVSLAAVIAFSLAIDKNADDISGKNGSRAKAFLAFSFIDFAFSLGAAVAIFYFNRK